MQPTVAVTQQPCPVIIENCSMRATVMAVNATNATHASTRVGSPWDDAAWILTSSFIIFTMQSGFGLLESGMASKKNEVNIMIKNVVDVVFGGVTYWAAGYGLSFGRGPGTDAFTGVGFFFLDPSDEDSGTEFSRFIFQASFATTASTIVSGAMAERTRLLAYMLFSLGNTFVYSFPAHWVWTEVGWLNQLSVVDVAGAGPVHLVGGVTALVAAILLKPRKGRFEPGWTSPSSNPVNTVLGLFILWWGWLGFNCGSTFGISGGKWKLAARAAAVTIIASCGGGVTSFILSYFARNKKYDVTLIVNGILGSLVSVTGICAVTTTWAALVIGSVGSVVSWLADVLLVKLKVDDPVGASSVHLACSVWGLLACGLFAKNDTIQFEFNDHDGLFWGGGTYLLGVQALAVVAIAAWSASVSLVLLLLIQVTVGLRVSAEEERLGSDYVEHDLPLPEGITLSPSSDIEGNPSSPQPRDTRTNSQAARATGRSEGREHCPGFRLRMCLCCCRRAEMEDTGQADSPTDLNKGAVASRRGCYNVSFEEGESVPPLTCVVMTGHVQNGVRDVAELQGAHDVISVEDINARSPSVPHARQALSDPENGSHL